MTVFNWQINQMNRLTTDGFVCIVHYTVTAEDTGTTASTYGTVGYTQEPDENYTPYADLTQDQVIGWIQNSLGKDTVEASLQSQIEAIKHPVQEFGMPWTAA